MTEMTEKQRAAYEAALARTKAQEAKAAEVPTQRIRSIGQGLSFGTADEIEAAMMNPMSALGSAIGVGDGADYSAYLDELRGGLKAYQEARPIESIGYELGGAAIPAIAGAMFTGGGSAAAAAPSLARLAAVGAAQGAGYAFGTGEGGVANRLSRVPGGAIGGAIAGPAISIAGRGVTGAANAVTDFARRKIGGRGAKIVETELQRLASETGKSVDEIVDDVANGRIMAENQTLLAAVRGYKSMGGAAATDIQNVLKVRPEKTRDAAMAEIQKYLSDATDNNVLRATRRSEDAAREAERLAYAPFKTAQAPQEVQDELAAALVRVPSAMDEVNVALLAETGQKPFMRVIPAEGNNPARVEFTRAPTVAEAEVVRRAIKNKATALYTGSQGAAGEAVAGVEAGLRSALDTTSPALKAARAEASAVRTAKDSFDSGRLALAKKADQIEVDFETIMAKGEGAVKAYRAGIVDALRGRMGTGRGKSTMSTLNDPNTNEGKILRTIFPQDELPGVLASIGTASGSQKAATAILGGSQTAETIGQSSRIGSNFSLEDVSGVMSADPIAIARTAGKVVSALAPKMTDAQRQQVVAVLLSEDPQLVRRALVDESAAAELQKRVVSIISGAMAGAKGAAVSQSGKFGGDITGGLLGNPQ